MRESQVRDAVQSNVRNNDRRHRFHGILSQVFAMAGMLLPVSQFFARPAHDSSNEPEPVTDLLSRAHCSGELQRPLHVQPMVSRVVEVTADEYAKVHQQIQPPTNRQASNSYLLHVLRTHGVEAQFQHPRLSSGRDILRTLTDARVGRHYWGNSPLVQTVSGWRFPTGGSADDSLELHRDHTLATFGELGLPLSFPLYGDSDTGTLGDVLADSLANFHLGQQELAWTVLAYALYLPPINSWTNRYGEHFSFDDLVFGVLDRPLDAESCGGSHLLHSLTVLIRVDDQQPILSARGRREIRDYLRRAVSVAVATQRGDGSWHSAWNYALLPHIEQLRRWSQMDNDIGRLTMTGHISEWLIYLPGELQPDRTVLERSGSWLKRRLLETTLEEKEKNYCPFTHAACVLRSISFVVSDSGDSPGLAANCPRESGERWSGP